jgi:hypothetical protein
MWLWSLVVQVHPPTYLTCGMIGVACTLHQCTSGVLELACSVGMHALYCHRAVWACMHCTAIVQCGPACTVLPPCSCR